MYAYFPSPGVHIIYVKDVFTIGRFEIWQLLFSGSKVDFVTFYFLLLNFPYLTWVSIVII